MNIVRAREHLSNPANYSGIWFVFHNSAANIKCEDDKVRLMNTVYETVRNFRCSMCRDHALMYLENNPVYDYWTRINDYDKDVGLFEYFWEFHNDVNKRLKKPILLWDDAYSLYYDDSSDCLECSKKAHSKFKLSG